MDISTIMQISWLLPLVGVGITVIVLWRVLGGLFKGQARDRKLLQTGAKASAQVLAVQATGASISYGGHRQPQVALTLQVQPASGQPFQSQLVTYVSELQIPQIQPGAVVQVRYNPVNSAEMAIEAFGGTVPGVEVPAGTVPAPVVAIPMARQKFPMGAIIGLVIGLGGAAVAVYVVMVNVGGFGLGSKTETDSICGKAAACCEKISEASGNKGSAANCKNLRKVGVPDEMCKTSLEGFKKSAESLKVTCE